MNIRNFGQKSVDEVKDKLVELGLSLKDAVPGFDGAHYYSSYDDARRADLGRLPIHLLTPNPLRTNTMPKTIQGTPPRRRPGARAPAARRTWPPR